MNTFQELQLSSALQRNLAQHKFIQPTEVQAKSIPPALAGSDVVATAQTGTGKTLAFVLPMLEKLLQQPKQTGVSAVVLSPTRELAIQIQETFQKLASGTGFHAVTVVGGLSETTQLNAIRRGAQVIIATPGRLCDFLQRRLVKLQSVSTLVLDEGDRMLDMGFLPSIKAILSEMPTSRQTLFFSATIEPSITHLINSHMKSPVRIASGNVTKPAQDVDLQVYEIAQDLKVNLLHHMLTSEEGSFLVFARTKHGVDRLAKRLASCGVKAARIHGDRSQSQRNQALAGFQQGEYRVLVATDVAARGIHVEGIAHVVNFDMPNMAEDFIHRVGRTGRAGARGTASTFITSQERGDFRRIERSLNSPIQRMPIHADVSQPLPQVAVRVIEKPAAGPRHHTTKVFRFKGNRGGRRAS